MKISNFCSIGHLGIIMLTMFGGQIRAANLTFGSPTDFVDDKDVWTAGSLQYAQNASAGITMTLNNVEFTPAGSSQVGQFNAWSGSNIVLERSTGSQLAVNVGSAATSYPAGMTSNYQSLLAFRTNGGNDTRVTLHNLRPDRAYVVQGWSQFPTHNGYTTWSNVEGTNQNSGSSPAAAPLLVGQGGSGGPGQYFIGGFTADATSQLIYQTCTTGTATNAIQVRDVTGYWSGQVDGNWNSTTGNFTGFTGGTNGAPSNTTGMAFNSPAIGVGGVNQVTFADKDGFAKAIANKTITIQSAGVSIGTVKFENNTGNTYTFANESGNTGITGATHVLQTGTGRVIFSGTNSYTGTTTVTSGMLQVNGTTGTGEVLIGPNGRLEGTGTILGPVKIQGTHAPGNSPGIQKVTQGIDYDTGSVFEWDLTANTVAGRGENWDGVNITGGTMTVANDAIFRLVLTNDVDFLNPFWAQERTWDVLIASEAGSIESVFTTFDVTGGQNYSQSLGTFSMDGSGNLNWSAIPEPSSALVGLSLAAGLLRRRRSPSVKSAL